MTVAYRAPKLRAVPFMCGKGILDWIGLVAGFSALLGALPALAGPSPDGIAGAWLTAKGDSIVRFDSCGTGWCGHIDRILRREPGAPVADVRNPDPALRNRRLEDVRLFSLDRFDGQAWRGTVYDPRSGRTYQALVRRSAADRLEIKGCFGIFCQTQQWTLPH